MYSINFLQGTTRKVWSSTTNGEFVVRHFQQEYFRDWFICVAFWVFWRNFVDDSPGTNGAHLPDSSFAEGFADIESPFAIRNEAAQSASNFVNPSTALAATPRWGWVPHESETHKTRVVTMSIIPFNKATDPAAPDDVRINTAAICFVEASLPDGPGQTMIHMLSNTEAGIAIFEHLDAVLLRVPELVAAERHYRAGPPAAGGSVVYIQPRSVSHLRPDIPIAPTYWIVTFVDGSEIRVLAPLPTGL